MFIIDFDDTLFDTAGFKKNRLASLLKFGVDEKTYAETYAEARFGQNGEAIYDNEKHARALAKRGFEAKKILDILESATGEENLKKFLFPETENFLKKIKATGEPLILLSLGDEKFQHLKTDGTGIKKYFDRVFFKEDTKEHALRELFIKMGDEPAWFINDKVDETKNLLKIFPKKLKVVLKKPAMADETPYKESGLPYFENLNDILEYVARLS